MPGDREVAALSEFGHTMLGLRADAGAERLLAANGGTIVAPDLHIWRLPSGTAQRLIRGFADREPCVSPSPTGRSPATRTFPAPIRSRHRPSAGTSTGSGPTGRSRPGLEFR